MMDISNIMQLINEYINKQLEDDIIELNYYEIPLDDIDIDANIIKDIYKYLSNIPYINKLSNINDKYYCSMKISNIIISIKLVSIDDKNTLVLTTDI
jgi:hypothetical protein